MNSLVDQLSIILWDSLYFVPFILLLVLFIIKRKQSNLLTIVVLLVIFVLSIINYIYPLDIIYYNIRGVYKNYYQDNLLIFVSIIYVVFALLTLILSFVILLLNKFKIKAILSSILMFMSAFIVSFAYTVTCDYVYLNEETLNTFSDMFKYYLSTYWYVPVIAFLVFIDYIIFILGYYKVNKKKIK